MEKLDRIEIARRCWSFAEWHEWMIDNPGARFPQAEVIELFRQVARMVGDEPKPRVWFKWVWVRLLRAMSRRIRNQRKACRELERHWLRYKRQLEREIGVANHSVTHYSGTTAELRRQIAHIYELAEDDDLHAIKALTRPYAVGQGLIDAGHEPNMVWFE